MANDVDEFLWSVATQGYEWREVVLAGADSPAPQPLLVFRDSPAPHNRTYAPLTEATGLFRIFADLPPDDPAALLGFANEYGLLGRRAGLVLRAPDDRPLRGGEPLAAWSAEVARMKAAVRLWDMISAGRLTELARHVRWQEWQGPAEKSGGWMYDSAPDSRGDRFRIQQPIREVAGVANWRDDPAQAAGSLVEQWINDRLADEVTPRLQLNPRTGRRAIRQVPKTLAGAMWLQFARTIEGDLHFRACKLCGRYFEISKERTGHRADREFCSDACKSRDYRTRRGRALELKAQGKTLAAIAKETVTDLETVKGWISQYRKRGSK